MTDQTLNNLKLITSTVAPILTFILALLNGFTEKKKDKEFKNGELTYTKKVLTTYGKTIITLLIISACLALSGLLVDEFIKERKAQVQKELDALNTAKRDSILNTAKLTLDTVITALKTTKEIQATAQEMTNTLTNQTERIKKLSVPLFPMKIIYSFERRDELNKSIYGADNGITCQDIIDALNEDLGSEGGHGFQKYSRGELLFYSFAPYNFKPPLPYYIHVYQTSYNEAKTGNSNLMKLSKLVYDKFAPLDMECNFYKVTDNFKQYDKVPLKIFMGKQPKKNSDILFSYTVTVFPSDSIKVGLDVEVSDPGYVFNNTNSLSWMDFDNGYLRIYCPWGQIQSVNLFTGPQYSYSMPFKITEADRIDHKTEFQKRIIIK